MTIQGILIGVATFFIIGLLHPVVIKTEYYFGKRLWPVYLITGCGCLLLSLFFGRLPYLSALLGITGFSLLWSIKELFEQEDRVKKGWYPKNPKRAS